MRRGTSTLTPHETVNTAPHPRRLFCSLVITGALIFTPVPVVAEQHRGCWTTCQSLPCVLKAGRCLLEAGDPRAAKNVLRPQLKRYGSSVPLRLLLVKAYLQLGNMAWARRVLYEVAEVAPQDCQARAFLIWFHLGQAELVEAEALLARPGCGVDGTVGGRWRLLEGTLARYRKRPDLAVGALDRARAEDALVEEDQDLRRHLEAYVRPGASAPIKVRAELSGGFASDGLAGSPSDAAHHEALPSPVVTAEILTTIAPPWGRRVHPLLEVDLRGLLFTRQEVRDYSTISLGLRPGVGWGAWRLFYHGQLFMLAGGDKFDEAGPRWYYETHRGELDWAPRPWLTLMAGAGRSIFRETSRSRTELDGSVGLTFNLWRVRMLSVLSYRLHWATLPAYNLGGGVIIFSGTLPLGPLSLRGRLLSSFDIYPDSAGFFGQQAEGAGESRRDLLIKGGLEVWSPSWNDVRAGITYELSDRQSTASAYEYQDHRLLLRFRFSMGLDPGAPTTAAASPGHVRLPYGLTRAKKLEDERIQDLLRQEDAARRGSSCVN